MKTDNHKNAHTMTNRLLKSSLKTVQAIGTSIYAAVVLSA